jgi:hypothetical protein
MWIVGDVPDWVTGVHALPLSPHPDKFRNQQASLTAFVNHPDAPAQAYLFNDDMFVMQPIVGPLPTFHLGSTEAFIRHRDNAWIRAVRHTADWMRHLGYGDVHCYEAHTPLLFDTAKLRDMLADYPIGWPLAVGEMYPAAGVGGEGVNVGNAKCGATDSVTSKLGLDMPFLSCSPESWAGRLGDYVRAVFEEPCRWEQGNATDVLAVNVATLTT